MTLEEKLDVFLVRLGYSKAQQNSLLEHYMLMMNRGQGTTYTEEDIRLAQVSDKWWLELLSGGNNE